MSNSLDSDSSDEKFNVWKECILVWEFKKAPDKLQSIGCQLGDEDWLAFVPENIKSWIAFWLEENKFGNFVYEHNIKNISITIGNEEFILNGTIYVSCHA